MGDYQKAILYSIIPAVLYDLSLYFWYPCLKDQIFHGNNEKIKAIRLFSATCVTIFSIYFSKLCVC